MRGSHKQKQVSLPRTSWRYVPVMLTGLIFGLVTVLGLWVWQRLNDPRALPFHEIRVSGELNHVTAAQVRQILRPQINGGFFVLKLTPLKQKLLTLPWIKEISIRRIPGILLVNVREHHPVARWNNQYLINSSDQVFPAPRDTPAGLPQLIGPQESEALVYSYFKQINSLLIPLHCHIQRIIYDDRQNWELMLSNGVVITAGHEEVLKRMERLVRWYPQIADNQLPPVAHIDLRYANSMAVSRKSE